LIYGHAAQLGIQALSVVVTMAYSAVATFIVLKAVSAVVPLRADRSDEGLGMDVSQHGEEAYAESDGAILVLPNRDARTAPDRTPSWAPAGQEGQS
jgi:Amt family ammonium transporter